MPYPLYFYESPYVLLAIPLFPTIANIILKNDLNYYQISFLIISALITKVALISIIFLITIFQFSKIKQRIYIFILFIILSLVTLNFVIPFNDLYGYFKEIHLDIFNFKMNFSGLHKVLQVLSIIFALLLLKNRFNILIFLPSAIIFILFPASSPGQLFYTFLLITLIVYVDQNLIFKENFINKLLNISIKKYLILFVFISSLFLGLFYNFHFFYYFFYFSLFLLCFNVGKEFYYKNITLIITIIILLNTTFNSTMREDNVLTIYQKNVYLKTKELTKKEALIFSDLNLENTQNPPWGLYTSIAERQFYISSFYSDYRNKFNSKLRNEMIKFNDDVIKNNKHPLLYFKDTKFKEFYILTHKSNPTNINTDIIFQTEDFKLLKFR